MGEWLQSIRLDTYAASFAVNEISGQVLLDISLDDLDYMDVTILGHRKLILKGIEDLRKNKRVTIQVCVMFFFPYLAILLLPSTVVVVVTLMVDLVFPILLSLLVFLFSNMQKLWSHRHHRRHLSLKVLPRKLQQQLLLCIGLTLNHCRLKR